MSRDNKSALTLAAASPWAILDRPASTVSQAPPAPKRSPLRDDGSIGLAGLRAYSQLKPALDRAKTENRDFVLVRGTASDGGGPRRDLAKIWLASALPIDIALLERTSLNGAVGKLRLLLEKGPKTPPVILVRDKDGAGARMDLSFLASPPVVTPELQAERRKAAYKNLPVIAVMTRIDWTP